MESAVSDRQGDFNLVVQGFRMVLEGLGVEDSEHTAETPQRAARAWWNEICAGLTQEPPKITTFASDSNEMVVLRGVPVKSICAHHLLPFIGEATIAYIPGRGRILGLSKLSRLTDYWSRRLQVQEELTAQVADAIAEHVCAPAERDAKGQPTNYLGGVGVMIRANHMCMMLRGVKHSGDMVTSALRGVFRSQAEVRAEFYSLIGRDK